MAWVKVGKIGDIDEGKSQVVNANGKEMALFKIDGKIYAIENVCPHRGGPLAEGYVEGSEITCPWHAWTFDVKTGICQTVPDMKQPVFPVKTETGDIFVEV